MSIFEYEYTNYYLSFHLYTWWFQICMTLFILFLLLILIIIYSFIIPINLTAILISIDFFSPVRFDSSVVDFSYISDGSSSDVSNCDTRLSFPSTSTVVFYFLIFFVFFLLTHFVLGANFNSRKKKIPRWLHSRATAQKHFLEGLENYRRNETLNVLIPLNGEKYEKLVICSILLIRFI